MEIPGIGKVEKDQSLGWYYSEVMPVKVLGGIQCRIVVADYDEDEHKEDFHVAIANFLAADESVLRDAGPHIFEYYERCKDDLDSDYFDPDDEEYFEINSVDEIWSHIRLGNEPRFERRAYGDKGIYVSLEGGCDWEEEHGLQIVFKNGLIVNKIGPYDGHLTNSDAYGDDSLEDVIFK